MDFQFIDRLRFDEYRVQLRLKEPARFHYFHGPALNGLLCSALNQHPLGPQIALYPVESGRIDYREGDLYNFGLTLFGQCPDLADYIRSCLSDIGTSPPIGKTLGAFSVAEFKSLPQPPMLMNSGDEVTLQFVTPLRMERQERVKGKQFFDPDFFDLERFLRLLHDRAYDLCKLADSSLPQYQPPDVPKTGILQRSLIWIDAPWHARSKTFGGVVGFVRLRAEMSEDWKCLLWLGQRIHVGRNSAFGFGRYILNPPAESLQHQAAKTILELSVRPSNMMEAFQHVKLNKGQAGSDGETIEDFESDLLGNLDNLSNAVRSGKYRSRPLTGIVMPKTSGKVRALAIPTVRDRILQRAVTQILGPSWDLLLEESSFAYRKGLSRVGAAKAIQKAYNEGFRYILESDVESFFDNVDWDIMEMKLRSLLIQDPVIDIIMRWVKQDVVFEGQLIERIRGLPQGAAVSPLLANLYLDQFDESLQDDFRLIRYADDFVVLCKSKERAQEALEKAKDALIPLKLDIKPSKTKVVNFEHGFQYLGYIFCRSLVIESEKEDKKATFVSTEGLSPEQIPQNSWLTHVDLSKIREIKQPTPTSTLSLAVDRDTIADERFPIYLTDPDIFVRLSGQSLIVSYRNRQQTNDVQIPFSKILAVIDYGKPSITLHAVAKLSQASIPTYFQNRTGKTYLAVPSVLPDYSVWLRQMQFQNNPESVVRFAKAIVCAKIHNHRVLCARRGWDNNAIQNLKELENKCEQAESTETILGYEGRAAAVFFQQLSRNVPGKWSFHGRMKHPPTDPVNAMLSFGYSCLYHHVATALQVCGLNPAIGWYHESRSDYFALACDIQEEFRFLVDGLVLYLLNRNMVAPEDFQFNENARMPVLMSNNFRKFFLGQLEERLMTEFKPDGDSDATVSYRRFFVRQARQLLRLCMHPEKNYNPLRIH